MDSCLNGICAGYIDEDQTIFRICCTTTKVSDKSVRIIDYNLLGPLSIVLYTPKHCIDWLTEVVSQQTVDKGKKEMLSQQLHH